jgi:hypothetical protein
VIERPILADQNDDMLDRSAGSLVVRSVVPVRAVSADRNPGADRSRGQTAGVSSTKARVFVTAVLKHLCSPSVFDVDRAKAIGGA